MRSRTKLALAAGSGVVSAPVSYVVQRVLGTWGALDEISDATGRYLKVHITPEQAGWTIAAVIFFGLWALMLHFIWKSRKAEASKPQEIAPEDEKPFSYGIVIKGKTVSVKGGGAYGHDLGIHVEATESANVEDSFSVGSGRNPPPLPPNYRPAIPPELLEQLERKDDKSGSE